MKVTDSDIRCLTLAAAFKLVTSTQFKSLVFASHASGTQRDRSMKRLSDLGLLRVVGVRTLGGTRRGGRPLIYTPTTKGYRAINWKGDIPRITSKLTEMEHALDIVDVVCQLKEQEAAGVLKVVGFLAEPQSHVRIGNRILYTDLNLGVEVPSLGKRGNFWVEVDRDTQGDHVIIRKISRYVDAYEHAREDEKFSRIVFATRNDDRARALKWIISRHAKDHEAMFDVVVTSNFVSLFQG